MSALRPPLPEPLLLDYAAGAASPGISLLLSTHLAMSVESRAMFAMMELVGGALFEDIEGEALDRISAANALDVADADRDAPAVNVRPGTSAPTEAGWMKGAPAVFDGLPEPLLTVDAEAGWRSLGLGVAAAKLDVPEKRERTHLLWARGGTGIATHRHVGREVVLVLKGAFWDDGVRFGPSDVAISEDGSVHSPRIDEGGDCLCLAVTEAPVHFTGFAGFVLNRLCRF